MQSLTREQILAADDLRLERVDALEWGGCVYVRMLTAAEALQFHADGQKDEHKEDALFRIAALTIVDENGNRLFTVDDAKDLAGKSHAVIQRICQRAMELNGLGGGDDAKND